MKNILFCCLLLQAGLLITLTSFYTNIPVIGYGNDDKIKALQDSVALPDCIQKKTKPGSKGIRSYNGAQQFLNTYKLKSGKVLYAFRNEASIGCNSNEPAGKKYYDDSCKLVGRFPAKFSIKQGFKPYIAKGYLPGDFIESQEGDYPLYFNKQPAPLTTAQKGQVVKDPFPKEKWFVLGNQSTPFLGFKKGDVIKIHTQTGLWQYRNKKLLNQYKIVPQLAIITQRIVCARAPCPPIITKKLVYFIADAERFIDISFNSLLVSDSKQKDAHTPNTALETKWVKVCDLTAQSNN